MSKTIKIIVYVVLVFVLIVGIGLIVKFTEGLSGDFKTFYVTINGEDIMSYGKDYEFDYEEQVNVEVHYVFEKISNSDKGYSVKVVPTIVDGEDFDFILNGEVYSFQAEEDITAGFDIAKGEKSFTIQPKGTVASILQAVYPDKEVGVDGQPGYGNMYTLIVTSYDGEASVTICFTLSDGIQDIVLDKENISF